jgi:hypothetical protein
MHLCLHVQLAAGHLFTAGALPNRSAGTMAFDSQPPSVALDTAGSYDMGYRVGMLAGDKDGYAKGYRDGFADGKDATKADKKDKKKRKLDPDESAVRKVSGPSGTSPKPAVRLVDPLPGRNALTTSASPCFAYVQKSDKATMYHLLSSQPGEDPVLPMYRTEDAEALVLKWTSANKWGLYARKSLQPVCLLPCHCETWCKPLKIQAPGFLGASSSQGICLA